MLWSITKCYLFFSAALFLGVLLWLIFRDIETYLYHKKYPDSGMEPLYNFGFLWPDVILFLFLTLPGVNIAVAIYWLYEQWCIHKRLKAT